MKRLLALLLCLVLALSLLPAAAAEDIEIIDLEEEEPIIVVEPVEAAEPAATGSVAVDEAHFPNETFRDYVSRYCDTDGNGVLSASEIAAVTDICCINKGKLSLKGIEYFTELEILECYKSQVSSLDLSKNIKLKKLDCFTNNLTVLDLSHNINLEYLRCYGNDLTSIDLSNCSKLATISVSSNELTELDLSDCAALTNLECGGNPLIELNLTYNTALERLSCSNTGILSLNLSQNTALTYVGCSNGTLLSLDVSKCKALTELYVNNDNLTKLDVSKNTALTILQCSKNELSELDVLKNTALTELYCYGNELKELHLFKNASLTELYCWNNQIEKLYISECPRLLEANASAKYIYGPENHYVHSGGGALLGYDDSSVEIVTEAPAKPAIGTQPKSLSIAEGKTASFTVKATSEDLSYQWQYRTSSSGSWTNTTLPGCRTATLSVEAKTSRNGYQYRCKITNASGTATSSAATLTVMPKPTITTQPASKTVAEGETVKFTVKASNATAYQWYYRTSSTGSWKKSSGTGATTATLTVSAASFRSGYQYRCKVTNDAGYRYSSAATLTVQTKPTITTQPADKTASAGTTVKFTVKATGATAYQWYYRTSSTGTWKKCSGAGATSATLSVEAKSFRSGYQYKCRVSNEIGYRYSSVATLTVK